MGPTGPTGALVSDFADIVGLTVISVVKSGRQDSNFDIIDRLG